MTIRTRLLAAAGMVVVLAATAYLLPLANWTLGFVHWVQSFGAIGALIYSVAYVTGTVLFFPGAVLTAGAGFLFGPFWGTVIASPASVFGATIAFLLGRSFARGWIEKRISRYPRFGAIDRGVEKQGFKLVLLMRLHPLFIPFGILNYSLGLTRVRLRDYVLASWIGMLPATILYAYLGSAARNLTLLLHGKAPGAGPWQPVLFWGGLVATVIIVFLITRITRQAFERQLDAEPEKAHPIRTQCEPDNGSAGRGFLAGAMKLSIIIPVLNERECLPTTLSALQGQPCIHEVIVVDGGSTDGTRDWLRHQSSVHVIDSASGRGNQMNAGAEAATGDTLLFLHADCFLPHDAAERLQGALSVGGVVGGCFRVRFAEAHPRSLRVVVAGINMRTILFRSATGDQAIFVRHSIFESVGSFQNWPLFEDIDLVRRIKRAGKFVALRSPVTLSARRYIRHGVWRTTFLMFFLRLGFWAGVPVVKLKRWFVDVRPHLKTSPRH